MKLCLATEQWTDGFPPPLEDKVTRLATSIVALLGRRKSDRKADTGVVAGQGFLRHEAAQKPVGTRKGAH